MLSWISASDGVKYAEVSKEFTKKVKGLGENEAKREVFL
jgi:coenzyme F420-reducing hydrogenase delta subunit